VAFLTPWPTAGLVIWIVVVLGLQLLIGRGAARATKAFPPDRPFPASSRWYCCLAALIVTGLLTQAWLHAYKTSVVEGYRLAAGSMEPTILRGDYVWVAKWAYGWREPLSAHLVSDVRSPQRGDLVVFRYPDDRSRAFLKRCIGLPGETVELRSGAVLINGQPLKEPYVQFLAPVAPTDPAGATDDFGRNWGPLVVPQAMYFMLGDNRDNSRDSRYWGFLPENDLLGKATVVYWSTEPSRDQYSQTNLSRWLREAFASLQRTRWQRIGHRLQ
jgi:signal peptidase I